ncbi:PITH domain-containing protein, partial [Rozella allomycis CSF55]
YNRFPIEVSWEAKIYLDKVTVPFSLNTTHGKLYGYEILTMGFDEVDSIEPTQTIQLDEKDIGKVVPLRFVKFQNVHTVVIFIEDNQAGDDETIIENIQIIGQTIQGTNMGDFNKKEEQ